MGNPLGQKRSHFSRHVKSHKMVINTRKTAIEPLSHNQNITLHTQHKRGQKHNHCTFLLYTAGEDILLWFECWLGCDVSNRRTLLHSERTWTMFCRKTTTMNLKEHVCLPAESKAPPLFHTVQVLITLVLSSAFVVTSLWLHSTPFTDAGHKTQMNSPWRGGSEEL